MEQFKIIRNVLMNSVTFTNKPDKISFLKCETKHDIRSLSNDTEINNIVLGNTISLV